MKNLSMAIVLVLMMVGCAGPRQYAQPNGQPVGQNPAIVAGYVPVVMVNPSPGLTRHIFLFEGYERVELLPDARNGGWMFNRPPVTEFKIAPANDYSWHKELWVRMPRNTSFTAYDQAERFWGSPVGQPNIVSFVTGSNPMATTYYQQSPAGVRFTAGAVVYLPFIDPTGPTQLRINYFWNPGAVIKEGIYSIINNSMNR